MNRLNKVLFNKENSFPLISREKKKEWPLREPLFIAAIT